MKTSSTLALFVEPQAKPKKKKRPKVRIMSGSLDASFQFCKALNRSTVEGSALVFRLPFSSWSVNSEVHWRTKEKIHNLYEEHFEVLRSEGKLPPLPATPFPRAMVRVSYYTQKHNDFDNLFSRSKVAFDLIVKAGYLEDDSPEHLRWSEPPLQFVYGWAEPYVVIRMWPVDEFPPVIDEEPLPINPADVLAAQKAADREKRETERKAKREQLEAEKVERARVREEKRLFNAAVKAAKLKVVPPCRARRGNKEPK